MEALGLIFGILRYIQGSFSRTRGPGASLYTDNHWWIRKTNMAARQFGGFAGRGFTSLFPLVVRSKRWSQITDSTRKNMNFQALFEVQEMVLFMADLVCIELAWDEMRFNASVCYNWLLEWLFLKSTIILHGLRRILSQTRSHGDNFGASNIEHRGKFM